MAEFDFDTVIERRGSGALKYDELGNRYGNPDLLPLWVADMDFAVPPAVTKALVDRMMHPIYGYAAPTPAYWQSIIGWLKRRHDFDVTTDELRYIPGVVKGIGFVVNYFTRPGDKVLIQPPVYHPFRLVPQDNGRKIVENPLLFDGSSYRMDLDGLAEVVEREKPRLMILCNPHNPIGLQWDADTLRRVAEICHKAGVIVISDEIHSDLMLWGKKHVTFASVSPEAAEISITMGAPSKTFNIAGLVSSWVIIKNPELREGFFGWMRANEFDDPTFVATIATEAAYNHGGEWLDQLISYLEGNVVAVEEYLAAEIPSIKAIRPEASFLLWLDCRALGLSHDELNALFVDKAGLALNDGEMFGREGAGFMRFNIGAPRSVILKALARLKSAVDSLPRK
ncbi:MAG: PatB family C-S lyase [Muribaculaceae bacterium]|nr:PatB family C-S lyase [Muribaculaceae bacterium]